MSIDPSQQVTQSEGTMLGSLALYAILDAPRRTA